MNRKIVFWILTVVLGFILQITFSRFITVWGVFPNLLLLGTVFFAVQEGPIVGEWVGFIWGILSDVASMSIFGSQTFMFTLIGYSSGCLEGKIDEEKPVVQMGLVFMMSIIHIIGLMLFESMFIGSTQRFKVKISFLQPIYSTLVSPIVFLGLAWWYYFFNRLAIFREDTSIRHH